MSYQDVYVGYILVRALRVAYGGELGWELHHPIEYQQTLYDHIMEAGKDFGIVYYGYLALESIRLEKGYLLWGKDITNLNTPLQVGLENFIKLDKGDFLGRVALRKKREHGVDKRLVCMTVADNEPMPHGCEPILDGQKAIGYVTSGDYGYVVGTTIALGYVPVSYSEPGQQLTIKLLGEEFAATVVKAPIYDPENRRMRG